MKTIVKCIYREIRTRQIFFIFTDGSKIPDSGVTSRDIYSRIEISIFNRFSNNLARYIVELVTIMVALQWTEDVRPDRVIICSLYVST